MDGDVVFPITPAKLAALAYCERGVVVKVRSSSSASIPKHSGGSATASCHPGETLLSGALLGRPPSDVLGSRTTSIVVRVVATVLTAWGVCRRSSTAIAVGQIAQRPAWAR